ncbi:MAG TPA: hypothetical protein VHG28_16700 [Longimicrobiaceae bacterium]|nr:hypothetical protein [Longimicrobiaceae bacterium]
MRVGDVSVQLVPVGGGEMIEGTDGRVLARPGQVYAIRITNHSDRRAVAKVDLDGTPVTEGGLVLGAGEILELERPVTEGEHGRFTVFPEGTESVFGDSGGRDNPDLGLVEVEYRRELPPEPPVLYDVLPAAGIPSPPPPPAPRAAAPAPIPRFDAAPASLGAPIPESDVQGAAGTGLTGRSQQTFRTVEVGPLEREATRVRLRIVIGRTEAFDRPRPLPGTRANPVPPRPAPRP